jgi:hypothetical protein
MSFRSVTTATIAQGKLSRKQFRINISSRTQKIWHYRNPA